MIEKTLVSIIIIGLNEENLLAESIQSVINSEKSPLFDIEIIYIDSGSIDKSLEIARSFEKVSIFELKTTKPSAAKARNLGLKHAKGQFVQFLDGDSALNSNWLKTGISFLLENPHIACAFGGCVEKNPSHNTYTKMCSFDWFIPAGEHRLCGGNSLWYKKWFDDLGSFDEQLSVGEEPDFCQRVRQKNGKIICLDHPMVLHDLEMNSFQQYWNRGVASGRAYALVGWRYRKTKEKLWFKEMLRNFIEPIAWLSIFSFLYLVTSIEVAFIVIMSIFTVRTIKIALSLNNREILFFDKLLYGLHLQIMRLPLFWGQLKVINHLFLGK